MRELAPRVADRRNRAAKAGRPPVCRYSVRMSGVLGHRLARKYSLTGGSDSSVKYCASSAGVLRHAKYVYDCVNPTLASRNMTLGRVNASARRITSGWPRLTSAISHSQTANVFERGLSIRITVMPSSTQYTTIDCSHTHL